MKKLSIIIVSLVVGCGVLATIGVTAISPNNTKGIPANNDTAIQKLIDELIELEQKDYQLDKEEKQLEQSYQTGKISLADYQSQDAVLDKEDHALELKEDQIEAKLKSLGYTGPYIDDDKPSVSNANQNQNLQNPPTIPTENAPAIQKLLDELVALEQNDYQLDVKDEQLEQAYRLGQITLADYQAQDAALDKEENALDVREDQIEVELRALGYRGSHADYENDDDDYDDDDDDDHYDYD